MNRNVAKRIFTGCFILLLILTVVLLGCLLITSAQQAWKDDAKLVAHLIGIYTPIILVFAIAEEFAFYISIRYFLFSQDRTKNKTVFFSVFLGLLSLLLIFQICWILPYLGVGL